MSAASEDNTVPSPRRNDDESRVIAGKYVVERTLGQGGFGTVFLVRHATLGWRLALKLLRDDFTDEPEYRASFLHEMETVRDLVHPNGVVIRDAGCANEQLYFTMDYIPGDTVRAILKKSGALPVARVLSWAKDTLAYLAFLHSRDLVHRDLKPENLMVTEEGGIERIKVLDLGIAKKYRDASGRIAEVSLIKGTISYMAPEQKLGRNVDPRTDVYAFGLVLWECLAGKRPSLAADGRMPRVGSQVAGIPKRVDQAITKALEEAPDRRHASAEEFLIALGVTSRRRLATTWIAIAMLSLALVIAWQWARQSGDSAPPRLVAITPADGNWVDTGPITVEVQADSELGPMTRLGEVVGVVEGRRASFAVDSLSVGDRVLTLQLANRSGAVASPIPYRLRVAGPASAQIDQPMMNALVGEACTVSLRVTGVPPFRLRLGQMDVEVDAQGIARPTFRLPAEGACTIELQGSDALGRSFSAQVPVVSDQTRPRTLGENLQVFALGDDVDIEIRATEPLARAEILGSGSMALSADRLVAFAKAPAANSPVRVRLTDDVGLSNLVEVAVVRLAIPSGLEAIPGVTGHDRFGQGWATPVREPRTGIVLCFLPPTPAEGFAMGAIDGDIDARDDERPRHQVRLTRGLYLGKAEVTRREWARGRPGTPAPTEQLSDCPVQGVRWEQASQFATDFGLRLPSEAEWEWACRIDAGGARFVWGDRVDAGAQHANIADLARQDAGLASEDVAPFRDGFVDVCPVLTLASTPSGFHGLAGNVAEFCSDPYVATIYGKATAGEVVVDPVALVQSSAAHVARGGSFRFGPAGCRVSRRFRQPEDRVYDDVGFRVARTATRD